MKVEKVRLEEVYNFLKGIRFEVAGYSAQLEGVRIKGGDWLSFFIHNTKEIKEGMEYTLIAKSLVEGNGYSVEGTEVYMASTPLKSGNVLIEVKVLYPYTDSQGWAVKDEEEFAFIC